MLLDNNTKKVINLINNFDTLNNIDKLRLSIYILENKNFNVNFNTRDIIILLKEVLSKLDCNNHKTIVNFSRYKHLLFFSAKYLELSNMEKKKFTVEMLFNIYETDFNDKIINNARECKIKCVSKKLTYFLSMIKYKKEEKYEK